jgi:hypothetical protein
MNSMDNIEKDLNLEKLTKILSSIQNLYYKKKEQLEELELELSELKEVLSYLNSIVSGKSFHSAEELYNKAIKKVDTEELKTENYFKEKIASENVIGTKIKRKIFSKDEKELLCVLNFTDFNEIEIKFNEAEKRNIKETSERFIKVFIRETLIPIKEKNPEMKLNYEYLKTSDIIEKIKISNIKSIDEYDLITSKIRELLVNGKSEEKRAN